MRTIYGCTIRELTDAECARWIGWAGGGEAPEGVPAACCWLLAHCDDGVAWGRRDGADQTWRLSSEAFPDSSPPLQPGSLQTLRIFGTSGEALVWRSEAEFRGRLLSDTEDQDAKDPRRPADDAYLLLGDRVLRPARGGFTLVGDATGSRHAPPLSLSREYFERGGRPRLCLRQYFEENPVSGVLRIAASRLVEVRERP